MRYVITGRCGFVSSHVVQLLKSKGKKVAVIDKITNRELIDQKALLQNVQHFYMDISDPELMEKALLPDDIVIHLAAQSHVDVSFKNPVQTTVSNVVGIHSLLAACVKRGVTKIVIMSTDEVYGSTEQIVDVNYLIQRTHTAHPKRRRYGVTAYKTMHLRYHHNATLKQYRRPWPIYQQYHPTLFSSWFVEEIYAAW